MESHNLGAYYVWISYSFTRLSLAGGQSMGSGIHEESEKWL